MKKLSVPIISLLLILSLLVISCESETTEKVIEDEGDDKVIITETETGEKITETVQQPGMRDPSEPKYGGTLIALGGDPQGFDAGIMQSIMITETRIMNEPLIIGDWSKGPAGTGELDWQLGHMQSMSYMRGALAESYEMPDDETIIFHIRPGVHWWNKAPMNGREFTAEDAVWSLEREWANPKCWPQASNPPGQRLISVEALDKYTVECKVPPEVQGLLLLYNGWYIQMLPREVVEMYGDMNDWENVVGTGGFMLTDYVTSSSLTYSKNPDYWSNDPVHPENPVPYMDKVKLLIISDSSSQQAAFRTGKTDMLANVSVEDWQLFTEQNPDLNYTPTLPWIPTFPCGRLDKDLPFNDLRVRRALNLAVNQAEILEDYYKGHGAMLGYPFVPSQSMSDVYVPLEEMPESVQELFTYNPDKAKQLLADAGYPNGFKTEMAANPAEVDLLSIIREYFLAVGVDMEIKVFDFGAHFGMKKGRTFSEMIMADTYPYGFPNMHNVRPESASCPCSWGSDESRVAYNTVQQYLCKDDEKVRQAVKEVVPHILDNAWGVWLPIRNLYWMWWPWVQNYRGETNFGHISTHLYRNYIWVDEELKEAMGY
ncbi:MAG TPA: ABC transporter substrate-binding protein [Dehalococcoidia bacterium]|nr:ABC transporter substrate-binding protein [Dehalococcoidia bacterium]